MTVQCDERVRLYRQELVVLRSVLREKMEREYARQSADIQYHIDAIAYSYAAQGESIAKIAKRLGTTNWKTAADAVSRGRKRMTSAHVGAPRSDAFTVTQIGAHPYTGRPQWRVQTDKTHPYGPCTATLIVQPAQAGLGDMMIPEGAQFYDLDEDTTTALHSELRDNWTTSKVADQIRQMETRK